MKSASCVPCHVYHFIDYFKPSSLYKDYHLARGHRPAYALGKHLGVCTTHVLNLHSPSILRSTLCFPLAYHDMTTPSNQPNVLLLGLCCIAIFCFYSFPMVIFSWLLSPALDFGPCRRFKVTNSALVSESRAVWPVPTSLVTWFTCCLCRQWGGQRRGAAYVNWPSLSSTNPKANPLA